MLLLDANVISELVAPSPDPSVVTYLKSVAASAIFTSAICEAEIRYGLARMTSGHRRAELQQRMEQLLSGFEGKVLDFDRRCALAFGRIRADREAIGRPIGLADAMIAASASVHKALLVTRNVADFVACGVDVANPWMVGP